MSSGSGVPVITLLRVPKHAQAKSASMPPSTWGTAPPDARSAQDNTPSAKLDNLLKQIDSGSSNASVNRLLPVGRQAENSWGSESWNSSEWNSSQWSSSEWHSSAVQPDMELQKTVEWKSQEFQSIPGVPAAFKRKLEEQGSEPALPAAFKKRASMAATKPSMTQGRSAQAQPEQAEDAQAAGEDSAAFSWDSFLKGGADPNASSQGSNPMQNMMESSTQSGADPSASSQGSNPMQNMMEAFMKGGADPSASSQSPNPMQAMMQTFMKGGADSGASSQDVNPMQKMMAMMGMMKMMGMMSQMNQMGQMAAAGQGGSAGLQAAPAAGAAMDMSSWAGLPDDTQYSGDANSAQAKAVRDAVEATQQAQLMQQVQFMQQYHAHASKEEQDKILPPTESRFKDDYQAFKMCTHWHKGTCMNGRRCVYAHTLEELHPASPDMPDTDEPEEAPALSEMAAQPKEQDTAHMRMRKKRDLCRKFMQSGKCGRGATCPNAHGEDDVGNVAFVLYDKIKLQICNAWETGRCAYGAKCLHAHGDHEIGTKRREFKEGPPMKKRAQGQSLEDWKREILRYPDVPGFPC